MHFSHERSAEPNRYHIHLLITQPLPQLDGDFQERCYSLAAFQATSINCSA